MHVPPSLQQLKGQARRAARTLRHQHTESWRPGRGRRARYARQPPTTTTGRHPATTQGRWRTTAACASGLLHQEELQEDFEGQVCDHGEMYTVAHWCLPLSCPATAPLRPGPAPPAQPAGGGLLSGREKAGPPPHGPPHPERRDVGGAASSAPSR
ncbi:hypothetical protein GWK47_019897 [Chionoecetes opilio]|uniref:Uncharacterized protein n=1 Tax=Chionoecetes opilio TaxID=41210 RepID=A0A8J4XPL2_CHIOP|nr:hypothetical protein GWK47_019897 [Chionoecetes opilio]